MVTVSVLGSEDVSSDASVVEVSAGAVEASVVASSGSGGVSGEAEQPANRNSVAPVIMIFRLLFTAIFYS